MNKDVKVTEEEILEVFKRNRLLAGKSVSTKNHARFLHAVKEIINLQIKKTNG